MAKFDFCFEVNIGTATVAEIEGYALLERNEPDHSDWQITSVVLEGWGGNPELPKDHYLYTPIINCLYSKRREIDECWTEYVAEQAALKEAV